MQNSQTDNELKVLIDLHEAGDLDAARAGYEAMLTQRPDDRRVLYLYSLVLHQQGDHAGALEPVEHSLSLVDGDVHCLNHRGEVLLALGDRERAVASFKAALACDPSDPTAYSNLAVLHYQAGDLAGAVDYLVRGTEVAPNDCGLAVNSARILAQTGQREEARSLLENHLKNRPDDAEVLLVLDEIADQEAQQDIVGRVPDEDANAKQQACASAGESGDGLARISESRLSVVVPVAGDPGTLQAHLEAIYASAAGLKSFEVVLVHDTSRTEFQDLLQVTEVAHPDLTIVPVGSGGSFFDACNAGARQAQGNLLLFMRGQSQPIPGCLDTLLTGLTSSPQAGVIAGKVLMASEGGNADLLRVRHCGIVFDQHKNPKNLYEYCLETQPFVSRRRTVQAVSAACMLVRRDLFEAADGFSGDCGDYADLDLCFKVRAQGAKVVTWPDAVLVSLEGSSESAIAASRSADDDSGDYTRFLARWEDVIEADESLCYASDGLRLPDQGDSRLAMVTPLSPQKTGVAHYVQELLPYLASHAQLDLFVDDYVPSDAAVLAKHRVYLIRDLENVARLQTYNQKVYQIGNNRFHASICQAAMRLPGVVVLHEYDCKGCSNEPTNRELLTKLLGSSLGVIVHNEHARNLLQPEFPRVPFAVVPHIFSDDSGQRGLDRATARSRLSLPDSAFVVLSLGLVQPHKRNHVTVEAFARFASEHPGALLVLAGEAPDSRYAKRLAALAARFGVQGKVRITGWVSDEEFFDYLSAADVTVNLRYPSRGEESGSLTRILGCGRPAFVSDYAQFSEIPDDCVVKIGFENEVVSVAGALAHLRQNPEARESLSTKASRWLRERNAGERVSQLYADFAVREARAGSESTGAGRHQPPATVLWQGPVWDLTHPARDLILALDTQGTGVKVTASDVPLVMRSPINARARQRLSDLGEQTLAERYVSVYSGSAEHYRRDPGAAACILVVHDLPDVDVTGLDVDEFWVPSNFVRERLCRAGVSQERIHVVPYGVSGLLYGTSVFEPVERPQRLLVCPTDFSSDCGWDAVLLAFLEEFGGRKDVGLRLKLVGDAIESGDVESACVEGLRAFRHAHPRIPIGHFSNVSYERVSIAEDDMPAYYAAAAGVVCASRSSPFGRSLLEALAVGVPVIATAVGGQSEFVSQRNCLVVPVKRSRHSLDVKRLRKCMRDVIDETAGLARLGISGRDEVLGKWTWSSSAAVAAARISELVGRYTRSDEPAAPAPQEYSKALHSVAACNAEEPTAGFESPSMPSAPIVPLHGADDGTRKFGFNVISYVSGNLGIGVTARNVIQMLLERGFPIAVLDLDPGLGRKGHDRRFDQHVVSSAAELPYAVNLLILPPAELTALMAGNPAFFRDDSRLQVGFSMWELTVIPPAWKAALESLDVLVAESEFIRYAFQFSLSRVLTLSTEHPVYLPAGVSADRGRFDLPTDAVVFITSFEPFSDPTRKNPFAVIDAFLEGVGNDPNAHLVLKLNNAKNGAHDHPVMRRLREYTNQNSRIHLLTRTLEYAEVLSLYASCDVYVSLHRAEGLGLGMLEAMALGKPVIATAWSGNMSFMDHTNACLVGYELIPVDGSIPAYTRENVGPDALWADPNRRSASAWMRRLCDDPELRKAIGNRAQTAIQEYHRRARAGHFVDEIQAIWTQYRDSAASICAEWQADAQVPLTAMPEADIEKPVEPLAQAAADTIDADHSGTPQPLSAAPQGPVAEQDPYQTWIARHAVTAPDLHLFGQRAAARQEQPRFHVLVWASSGDQAWLADTLDAIDAQLHSRWVVTVLAEFPPPQPGIENLEQLHWVVTNHEASLAEVMNRAVERVDADWIAVLRAGDRIAVHAFAKCADYIDLHPEWRQVYTDEDRLDERGERIDPRFKPDFNLDLARSTDYFGQLRLTQREAWRQLGGLRDMCGAEQYDLSLRLLDCWGPGTIGHIADVLCHRQHSVGQYHQHEALVNQRAVALKEHLGRNDLSGTVLPGTLPGTFMVDYHWDDQPLVTVIIPTRDRVELLSSCVGSLLEKTSYPRFELLVIDNDSKDAATLSYLDELAVKDSRVRVLQVPGEFNFAALNNVAAAEACGDYLLLLNNDTMIVQSNWLERMLNLGMRSDVGIVGARLVYPDQTVQHAGIVAGMGRLGVGEHIHIGQTMKAPGYLGRAQLVQNFSAVTAACMLVRKDIYLDVGGMDQEKLKVLFNDVDFCFKVAERGFKIVWTPFATLLHHGSVSVKRNAGSAAIKRAVGELQTMEERWLATLARDPAYNRHLSLRQRYPSVETEFDAPWDPELHDRHRILGAGAGSFGSWQYRVVQPLQAMEQQGRAHTMLLPFGDKPDHLPGEGKQIQLPSVAEIERLAPDTLLMHNTLTDIQLKRIADYKRVNGAFVVFGQDDLMFELPRKNPFSHQVFKDMKKRLRRCLASCDRLVVTSQPLAEALADMASDIRIVPNYLDNAVWAALHSGRRRGEKPRVGWAGAMQHAGDLEILELVVRETSHEVDWVFFGMCPDSIRNSVREVHKAVPFEQYPAALAALDLDLAVAPLEHNRFNEAKSNLRLLEYGVLGWPVVCTDIHPYRDAPVTRVANNARTWIKAIRERVHDLDALAAEGDQLRRWVLENCMLDDHVQEWLDALNPSCASKYGKRASSGS